MSSIETQPRVENDEPLALMIVAVPEVRFSRVCTAPAEPDFMVMPAPSRRTGLSACTFRPELTT